MDYFTRYGLEFNPFLKNSKEILVDTNERRETLFRLDYLAKTKGFGLLTGGAGRGKTTIIRTWASGLNPSLYKVIYTSLSTLTTNDFYRNLAQELGHSLPSVNLIISGQFRKKSHVFPLKNGRLLSLSLMKPTTSTTPS